MSVALADRFTARNEILREIADLEARIEGLKAQLPVIFKKLYIFLCQPEKRVYIYSSDREEATRKLHARMNRSYQKTDFGQLGWKMASNVVREISPDEMASSTPGNFLSSLTREDALDFIADYNANARGMPPRMKDAPLDRVARDVRDYEKWLKSERRA